MARLLAAAAVVVIALSVVAVAGATVKRVSLTTLVAAGSYASLTVQVAPRARCTIQVVYDTVISKAKRLGPKTCGRITWRWRVGTSTHPGRWPGSRGEGVESSFYEVRARLVEAKVEPDDDIHLPAACRESRPSRS